MKTRCLVLILLLSTVDISLANEAKSHSLVKRQSPSRFNGQGSIPLSRSRQFPPPEELESSEYSEDEEAEEQDRGPPASYFRGRQPQRPPPEEDYSDDYSYTEAPKTTTPTPQKPTARTVIFNNRFAARPRFGSQSSITPAPTTTQTTKPATVETSQFRSRATPAQSQRLDVIANILNKPPPPRASERSISVSSRTSNTVNAAAKPVVETSSESTTSRRTTTSRTRTRNRFRPRNNTTTTTTTTTTTEAPLPLEEYYYYYEDDEQAQKNQPPIATTSTTTTTTTTTTTPKPSLPRRVSVNRRQNSRSQTPARPVVKFDPESQFVPPPEDRPLDIQPAPSFTTTTKKFTTTTPYPADGGGIPAHLRHKYRARTDGRFIDFLRDPNRPRELKGFDLTDYPFYVTVPEDIVFDCDDMKDGYYASVPHKCQLFHYCFAGARYDFLCANYTLYDQTTFTCRFANNVDCEASAKYYYRNDDLWKETTTTTKAPETTTPKKRRTTPKDEEYDDYYEDSDYEEEERRRNKRRRNRRKNRRKPVEEEEVA